MNTITSKDNKICKLIRTMQSKKGRTQYGLCIVEGQRAIQQCNFEYIEDIVVSEEFALQNTTTPETYIIDTEIFSSLATTEASQGIIAIVKIPESKDIEEGNILFLDRIQDPGNMGTIIRSASAFGFKDIILNKCTDPFAPKVVRSAMSALWDVNIIDGDLSSIPENRKKYASALGQKKKKMLHQIESTPAEGVCICVGNEANGLSDEVIENCDEVLEIAMNGQMESLNAAMSANIIMHHIFIVSR